MREKFKPLTLLWTLVFFAMVGVALYWWYHPTHIGYNDRFVLGSDMETVESRYGSFDFSYEVGADIMAGYVIRKHRKEGLFVDYWPLQYRITFNEQGIATKVTLYEQRTGG